MKENTMVLMDKYESKARKNVKMQTVEENGVRYLILIINNGEFCFTYKLMNIFYFNGIFVNINKPEGNWVVEHDTHIETMEHCFNKKLYKKLSGEYTKKFIYCYRGGKYYVVRSFGGERLFYELIRKI